MSRCSKNLCEEGMPQLAGLTANEEEQGKR
ncbi:hypothetical protein IGK47_004103 [Enterococcus sp. AZ007]